MSDLPSADEYAECPIYDPRTLYDNLSAKVTITYSSNGKTITRVLEQSHTAGLTAVIIVDFLTCALIMYGLLSTIYIPIFQAYLSLFFSNMEEVSRFTQMYTDVCSILSGFVNALLLHDLIPMVGPKRDRSANTLTIVEIVWRMYRSH